MNVKITYYLDVVSSWCYWAEPAWAELKRRYARAPVEFGWSIALLDENGHALQVTQRPTFALESNIGDRVVFSGLVKVDPLVAALDAMLDDAAGYASHAAHFGSPPPN